MLYWRRHRSPSCHCCCIHGGILYWGFRFVHAHLLQDLHVVKDLKIRGEIEEDLMVVLRYLQGAAVRWAEIGDKSTYCVDRFPGPSRLRRERHGKGVLRSVRGKEYVGEFRHGRRHGWGVLSMANGERYEGQWDH